MPREIKQLSELVGNFVVRSTQHAIERYDYTVIAPSTHLFVHYYLLFIHFYLVFLFGILPLLSEV